MKTQRMIAAVTGMAVMLFSAQAWAAEIKVLASTAVKTVLQELEPQFEKETGNKAVFTIAPAAVLKTQIDQGAVFDVAILTAPLTERLSSEGKIGDARTAVAHSGIGVAVKKGATKPDIGTVDAFKRTLLNAKSIGFTEGGASGAYLKTVFEKLGIANEIKPTLKVLHGPAGEAVANGDVEIGMTQISEILPYANAELVGPLPPEVQSNTYFSAGVSATSKEADAAKAFIKFLTTPPALAVIKAKGMEPG